MKGDGLASCLRKSHLQQDFRVELQAQISRDLKHRWKMADSRESSKTDMEFIKSPLHSNQAVVLSGGHTKESEKNNREA